MTNPNASLLVYRFQAVAVALDQFAQRDQAAAVQLEALALELGGNLFSQALAARWSARWDSITTLITTWTGYSNPALQIAAARAWGMIGRDSPETALLMLHRILVNSPRAASGVHRALPQIWPNHERYMLRTMGRWQQAHEPRLRRAAAIALGYFPGAAAPALDLLARSVEDPSAAVQRSARAARRRLLAQTRVTRP